MKYSFIVVNYNSWGSLRELLVSIAGLEMQHGFEVLIADNGASELPTPYGLVADFPFVRVLPSEINGGFGYGNNLAARSAKGEWLVLVNPDCRFEVFDINGAIEESRAQFGGDVILLPLIRYQGGMTQPSTAKFSNLTTFILQSLRIGAILRRLGIILWLANRGPLQSKLRGLTGGGYLDNFNEAARIRRVDWGSGACFIIRRETYARLGGFDENFFMYCEDEDLFRRAKSLNVVAVQARYLKVIHSVGGTQHGMASFSRIFRERMHSNILFATKHLGIVCASFLRLYYVVFFILGAVLSAAFGELTFARQKLAFSLRVLLVRNPRRMWEQ